MQSWSSTDPFYTRSTTEPNLQFRSMTTVSGNNPEYSFALRPWQWLYPKTGTGQYLSYDATRVQAGNVYNTVTMTTDGNTDTFVYGCNYYTSYGEFGGVSLNETFNLVGDRLLEFSADSREVNTYNFRPSRMTVACPSLRELCLYGCSTLSGVLNLSSSIRLETVDLRGTSITSVILPETDTLTTVNLPAVTALSIVNVPNLYNFSITNYNNLVNITTDNSTIALDVILNAENLAVMNLYNIDIETDDNDASDVYDVLVNPDIQSNITGHIYLDLELTQLQKTALEAKYGNSIWTAGSDFYITFNEVDILAVTLTATRTTYSPGDVGYVDVSFSGNNDASFQWTVQPNSGLTYSGTKNRLTITATNITAINNVTVTYTLTKTNGDTIIQTTTITVNPYTFYLNNVSFGNNPTITMPYSDADSTVTASDGWTVSCSDNNVQFAISGVSISGGVATYSGNTITSISKSVFADGQNYSGNVEVTVNDVTLTFGFTLFTKLVTLTIDDIPNVYAVDGAGTFNVTFDYTTGYGSYITITNVNVGSAGSVTFTVSNTSINGCTISFSNFNYNSQTYYVWVYYKVNNGANAHYYESVRIIKFVPLPAVKATYNVSTTESATQLLYSDSSLSVDVINEMKVDGNIVEPAKTFTFNTTGNHIVEYKFNTGFVLTNLFNSITTLVAAEISNVASIGQSVFYSCTNLESVKLDNKVASLSNYVFSSCSKLGDITITATTAPTVGGNTFTGIRNTGYLTFPNGSDYSSWFNYLYDWNKYQVTDGYLIYILYDQGNRYAYVCANSTEIYNTTGNVNIVIPDTYTYGGKVYPVTTLGDIGYGSGSWGDFSGYQNIVSVTIGNNVSIIGDVAFNYCTNLTTLVIGSGITEIGEEAFKGCEKLNTITINCSTAPYITNRGIWGSGPDTAGYSSGTTNVLYVPTDATGYDTADWTDDLLNSSYGKFTLSKTL